MLFYYYLLSLLWLPTLIRCLREFPPPLPVNNGLFHSSAGSFPWFLPPSPALYPPRSPNGLGWLPRGNPVGRSTRFLRAAAVPSPETTWTAPRREWAGNRGAGRESWAPTGQLWSKHPARWGGAGSGKRRRRLRRLRRFRTRSRCLQVPWAGLARAEGDAGR